MAITIPITMDITMDIIIMVIVTQVARTVAVAFTIIAVVLMNILETFVSYRFVHRYAKTVEHALLPTFAPAILVGLVLFVKHHNAHLHVKMEPPVRV